jgi:hypothetical protein
MSNTQRNHDILIEECLPFSLVKNKWEYRNLCLPNKKVESGFEKFLKIFGVKRFTKLSEGNIIKFASDQFIDIDKRFLKNLVLEMCQDTIKFSFSSGGGLSLEFINEHLKKSLNQVFYESQRSDIHIQHYISEKIPDKSKFNILIQPLDGTLVEKGIVDRINKYDLIITPSKNNKKQLIDSGIIKDIVVIPNFYIEEESNFIKNNKKENQKFTFYSESIYITRKNIDNLVLHFIEAFQGNELSESVKLIVKISTDKSKEEKLRKLIDSYSEKIPEIVIINQKLEQDELNKLWLEADCYICLSYMEGFCIPALKAVSCNIPVIALDSKISGYMDFLDDTNSLLVKCHEIDIFSDSESLLIHSKNSKWEEPDYEDYKSKLIEVINKKFKFNDVSDFELKNVVSKYKHPINLLKMDNFYEFTQLCRGLIKFLPNEFPRIDRNSNKKSLLVETRNLDHNEFVIKNTIQKLGNGWGHIIYCHQNNYNQIKSICGDISENIEIRLLDLELTRNSYNNLCLDINFWNEINCEKVLIYQTDTFILNKFDDEFLNWDYLGAMWYNFDENLDFINCEETKISLTQGNGGLSIRDVNMMISSLSDENFIKHINNNKVDSTLDKIPEDVYFSYYVKLHGKYKEVTDDFSIEPSFPMKIQLNLNENPFGFHKLYEFKNYEKFLKPKNFNPYYYFLRNLDLSRYIEINENNLEKHFLKYGLREPRDFRITTNEHKELDKNSPIFLFYHVYCDNNWEDIVDKQINLLRKSNFIQKLDFIYINVIGNKEYINLIHDKFSFEEKQKVILKSIENKYESETINLMVEVSKKINFKGIYIHSKSSSIPKHLPYKKYQTYWLDYMNYQILFNWKICNYYLENYDVVGTLHKEGNCEIDEYWQNYSKVHNNLCTEHFSGNFFWFNSYYFSKLDKLSDIEKINRFNCEWFPFKGKPKHFEIMVDSKYWVDRLKKLSENRDYDCYKNHNLSKTKVTVLITLYNYGEYIEDCINSVIKNNYKDLEILVINDCSTDDSLSKVIPYLKNKDINITIIDNKINSGLLVSRNLGIEISLGDYIFILDADNQIYQDCIEEHLLKIESENTIACYGIIECFDLNGNHVRNISNYKFDPNKLKWGNYIDAMAMFNKSKLISIGKYDDEMMNYGIGLEDYELWLKISKLGLGVSFIEKPLSKYIIKDNSMLSYTKKYQNELQQYLNKKYNTYLK